MPKGVVELSCGMCGKTLLEIQRRIHFEINNIDQADTLPLTGTLAKVIAPDHARNSRVTIEHSNFIFATSSLSAKFTLLNVSQTAITDECKAKSKLEANITTKSTTNSLSNRT